MTATGRVTASPAPPSRRRDFGQFGPLFGPLASRISSLIKPALRLMLAAADAYRLLTGQSNVMCAKLNHITHRRCIFNRCWFKDHAVDVPRLAAQQSQRGATGE